MSVSGADITGLSTALGRLELVITCVMGLLELYNAITTVLALEVSLGASKILGQHHKLK